MRSLFTHCSFFCSTFLLSLLLSCSNSTPSTTEPTPFFTQGIKIGEVTQNDALVWARLAETKQAASDAIAAGVPGQVQVTYWPESNSSPKTELPAIAVDSAKDFTCQIPLSGLLPATSYVAQITALSPSGAVGEAVTARFKTAAAPDQISDVTAVVVTCQGHETIDDPAKGHWVYSQMLTHQPDFFIHTGDVVYYDKGDAYPYSKTVAAARQRWNRMFAYEWNRDFHSQVSSYFMKDDHDTLKNDCWPGQTYGEITWEQGLALFQEQTPQGPLPYRSVRWGKDLEIWMTEGRDYRSPNKMPDGPDKTILGKTQLQWLKETLTASDATFKLVVFPSPVVGPDKKGKNDNHSNKGFTHEGGPLRKFLAESPNTYVVCGDRHWQYASKDPETGLIEICSGPINNEHSKRGGNPGRNDEYHLYYGGGKGGYLRINVSRPDGVPQLSFTWHGDINAKGTINHQLTYQIAAP